MNTEILPGGYRLAWATLSGESGHNAGRRLLAELYRQTVGKSMPPICVTEQGKPYFESGSDHFSISHTKNHVFCCLGPNNLGIDGEEADRRISPRLAESYLSQGERTKWEALGGRQEDLLRLWVLKEAYAKLTGRGIGNYLKETDFDPRDTRIRRIDGCLLAIITEK